MNKKEHILRNILLVIIALLVLGGVFGIGFVTGTTVNTVTNHQNNTSTPASLTTLEDVENVLLKDFYYGENTPEYQQQLIDSAIRGMVDAQGDPYTEYMSSEELNAFLGSLESSFVGIGVQYTMLDNGILVVKVLDYSPALAAGVEAGDVIIAIDGDPVEGKTSTQVQNIIRGKQGTPVTVTIMRETNTFDITITRDTINGTVSSEVRGQIGIIYLTSFADDTATELKAHLDKLKAAGGGKLSIDLRDNGGGYVTTLNKISSYFMDRGQIIMREYDREGNEIIDSVTSSSKYDFSDIAILVNNNSASCSEVFAQAMKENCNAVIIGETTYGKGVAQVTSWLSNGGAIKYTDVIWKSGNGVNIGGVGIVPDYEVRLHEVLYMVNLSMEENELLEYDTVSSKTVNVQYMLDFLGYDVDRLDGYYDAATRDAIMSFQKTMGLEVTGNVDRLTGAKLNSAVIRSWGLEKSVYDTQMNKALEILGQ